MIDPFLQSTYLGGSGSDTLGAIAIDTVSGAVYVCGGTASPDFPSTAGGAQSSLAGKTSAGFVALLDSPITRLVQATYLGWAVPRLPSLPRPATCTSLAARTKLMVAPLSRA